MLRNPQLIPQSGNLNDAEYGCCYRADRKKPGAKNLSGLRILFRMVLAKLFLHLRRKFGRNNLFLTVLALFLFPFGRLLFHQEHMLNDHENRQDDNPRQYRISHKAPYDPGICSVQRLCHRKHNLVQSQISPLNRHPLGCAPRDHKEGNCKIEKEADDLRPRLFPCKFRSFAHVLPLSLKKAERHYNSFTPLTQYFTRKIHKKNACGVLPRRPEAGNHRKIIPFWK